MRRALAIDEKSFGPEHPNVARDLNNLAVLLQATNRLAEAEPLMRRALAIDEKSFGPEHPNVASASTTWPCCSRPPTGSPRPSRCIAVRSPSTRRASAAIIPTWQQTSTTWLGCTPMRDDWAAAAALGRRAKPILIGRGGADSDDRNGLGKALLASNTWALRAHARAIYRASAESNASQEEGFELAQWALQTSAAQALSQMSARLVKGAGPLLNSYGSAKTSLRAARRRTNIFWPL